MKTPLSLIFYHYEGGITAALYITYSHYYGTEIDV